jgi:hypothetical protein
MPSPSTNPVLAEAATELLRIWINQGWRKSGPSTVPNEFAALQRPSHPPRKDIRALTNEELNQYRAKLTT